MWPLWLWHNCAVFVTSVGANDVIAQIDLCNHGDAPGGDVVALQTDLHCGECAPGGCDGIVSCHSCLMMFGRVQRQFIEAAEIEDAAG